MLGTVSIGLLYDRMTMVQYEGEITERFNGRTFNSPGFEQKKFTDLIKWQLNSEQGPWQERKETHHSKVVAQVEDGMRVTLVNHSTVLVQLAGVNILTDPIWSDRTGPFGKLGPARFRPPGIEFEKLPNIDLVVVSHAHYDHMDLPTLRRLDQNFSPTFVVGLGNAQNLAKVGIEQVIELDWWQEHRVNESLVVAATPAAHWSKRTALDTNRTLWAGYSLIENHQHRVFFAGDTGFGNHFFEVNQRLGAPNVALMPIGAYLPRWFMKMNHISPTEALKAAAKLGSDVMIPIHYGTFALGDDGQDQPIEDLNRAATQFPQVEIIRLDNGEGSGH